jgi:hypothetical protein
VVEAGVRCWQPVSVSSHPAAGSAAGHKVGECQSQRVAEADQL